MWARTHSTYSLRAHRASAPEISCSQAPITLNNVPSACSVQRHAAGNPLYHTHVNSACTERDWFMLPAHFSPTLTTWHPRHVRHRMNEADRYSSDDVRLHLVQYYLGTVCFVKVEAKGHVVIERVIVAFPVAVTRMSGRQRDYESIGIYELLLSPLSWRKGDVL